MRIIEKKLKSRKGSTLLLAIFVLGAMLIVGLGTSLLALQQLKISREVRKTTVAYYVAEGGIEDALWQLRKNEKTITDLANYHSPSAGFDLSATTTLSFTDQEEILYDHLAVNEVVSADLYSLDQLVNNNIRCVKIQWDGKPSSWLDLSWRSLNPPNFYDPVVGVQKKLLPYDGSAKSVDLTQGLGYSMHSLQIKALYDEVKNLRLEAYPNSDCSGTKINIPSRINISSQSQYPIGNNPAQQNLSVSFPEKTGPAPLFDYVIFSEEQLAKQIIHVGSLRPQLVYDLCGPFVIYPDCKYTYLNFIPATFYVRNLGIDDATISAFTPPDPTFYSVTDNTCTVGTVLTYNQTCYTTVLPIRASTNLFPMSVATSTPVTIGLTQR